MDLEVMKLKKEVKINQMNKERLEAEIQNERNVNKNGKQKLDEYYNSITELNKSIEKMKSRIAKMKLEDKKCKKSNQLMVSILQLKKQELAIETIYVTLKLGGNNEKSFYEVVQERERIKSLEALLLKK